MLEELYRSLADRYGRFLVLDLHSYNHRRDGPDQPPADPQGNPQVNVGTGTMVNRDRWANLIDRFMDGLAAVDFPEVRLVTGFFPAIFLVLAAVFAVLAVRFAILAVRLVALPVVFTVLAVAFTVLAVRFAVLAVRLVALPVVFTALAVAFTVLAAVFTALTFFRDFTFFLVF